MRPPVDDDCVAYFRLAPYVGQADILIVDRRIAYLAFNVSAFRQLWVEQKQTNRALGEIERCIGKWFSLVIGVASG
jgi:hypothetical protein